MEFISVIRLLPGYSHDIRKPYEAIDRDTHPLNRMAGFSDRGETTRVSGHEDHVHILEFPINVVDYRLQFLLAVACADDC